MAATKGFMGQLSFAACEWFLMFLMFIDAALAYILTKFAQYCELQRPCLFCLRLDHLFGNEEPGSYLSLFCTKHRAEISSLVSCDRHGKLADVREMCDDCFTSISVQNQSNPESYRFVGGRKGVEERHQGSFLNKNFVRVPSSTGACSCCKRQWKAKSSAQKLIQPSPVGLGASKVTVKPPLPRVSGRSRFHSRYSFKRMRDTVSRTTAPQRASSNSSLESLPHIGYTQLKIASDSESEILFSDDDSSSMAMCFGQKRGSKDDSAATHGGTGSQNQEKTGPKLSHAASDPGPLYLDENLSRAMSLTSNGSAEQDLGELNWEKLTTKRDPSPPPEPVSLNNCLPSNNTVEFPHGASADKFSSVSTPSESHDTETFTKRRKLSTNEGKENRLEDSSTTIRSYVSNSDEVHDPLDKNDGYESFGASSVSEIEGESVVEKLRRQVRYDRRCMKLLQMEIEEERNAASEAANQAMAMITRLQEEKAALHMEALQYLRMMEEQAEYDMEALRKANDLVAEKDKEIQDVVAELEFYRDQYEHLVIMGNVVMADNGEIDANSSYESKPINPNTQSLDLEDENGKIDANSSSEPKPIKPNAQSLDLEDENGKIDANSSSESKPIKPNAQSLDLEDENGKIDANSSYEPKPINLNAQSLDLEDEKKYIVQRLSELEKKFHQFSSRHTSIAKTTNEELQVDRGSQSYLSNDKDLATSNGSLSTHMLDENRIHVDFSKKKLSSDGGEVNLGTLENEISDLNERLEALEADRDFLEHACNALHNGGGLQFIQEIAHHLQDLRRITFDRRHLSVT